MSHASLVAQKGCEMDRLGRVILGEALHLPPMPAAALPRQEPQGPMSGSRELPVRLGRKWTTLAPTLRSSSHFSLVLSVLSNAEC
jgi:hypothetical protein